MRVWLALLLSCRVDAFFLSRPPRGVSTARRGASDDVGGGPRVEVESFGELEGEPVTKWTLSGGGDLSVSVISYGATLVSARAADRAGAVDELTVCYPSLSQIAADGFPFMGSTVGRVANRISGARFELDGATHALRANNFDATLHGGPRGWSSRVWDCADARVDDADGAAVLTLTLESADGDEGFPGAVSAQVTYAVCANELRMTWRATSDAPTPINLCNHAYWNLAGRRGAEGGAAPPRGAKEHTLRVDARARLDVDREVSSDRVGLPSQLRVTPVCGSTARRFRRAPCCRSRARLTTSARRRTTATPRRARSDRGCCAPTAATRPTARRSSGSTTASSSTRPRRRAPARACRCCGARRGSPTLSPAAR